MHAAYNYNTRSQEAGSVTQSAEVTLQQSQSMGEEPDLVGGRTADMMAEYGR